MISVIMIGTQCEGETRPEPGLCGEEGHDAEHEVSDDTPEDEDFVEIEPETMEQTNPSQTTDGSEINDDDDDDDDDDYEPVNFKRFDLNVNFAINKYTI